MRETTDDMNVYEIIADWLEQNGYDGLCNESEECGCDIDNLAPNYCMNDECVCAYKVVFELQTPSGETIDVLRTFYSPFPAKHAKRFSPQLPHEPYMPYNADDEDME